jgi:hypothetical protein
MEFTVLTIVFIISKEILGLSNLQLGKVLKNYGPLIQHVIEKLQH